MDIFHFIFPFISFMKTSGILILTFVIECCLLLDHFCSELALHIDIETDNVAMDNKLFLYFGIYFYEGIIRSKSLF